MEYLMRSRERFLNENIDYSPPRYWTVLALKSLKLFKGIRLKPFAKVVPQKYN
jgi:hypothetical protein